MNCHRCQAETAEACNDKGCFFLESGEDGDRAKRKELDEKLKREEEESHPATVRSPE